MALCGLSYQNKLWFRFYYLSWFYNYFLRSK